MIGIYKITNLINEKIYIGQSIDIKRRFATYKRDHNKVSSQAILRAIKKYGIDNFTFEPIIECEQSFLNYYEEKVIALYNSLSPNGYNLTTGGDSNQVSLETKMKMSNARKGKPIHTDESKKKMSESKLGALNPCYGKEQSISQRESKSKSFYIFGKYYIGTREAAKDLGMSRNTIRRKLNDNTNKDFVYDKQ